MEEEILTGIYQQMNIALFCSSSTYLFEENTFGIICSSYLKKKNYKDFILIYNLFQILHSIFLNPLRGPSAQNTIFLNVLHKINL